MHHLTAQTIRIMQHSATMSVSIGADLLDLDMNFIEDLTPWLGQDGSVERVMAATIHGTCKISLSKAINWGNQLVRLYMTVYNETEGRKIPLGVFTLTSPEISTGDVPPTYECTGYDRLYFLGRQVGNTYYVPVNVSYLSAIRSALKAAGLTGILLDGSAADKKLPVAAVWPLVRTADDTSGDSTPVTWLRIINDLLKAIGYRGLYCDEQGLYRSEPYADPSTRPPEYTFTTVTAKNPIISEQRTYSHDLHEVPNRWVFIQQNRDPAANIQVVGDGIYVVENKYDGITSQSHRGLVYPSVIMVDAADQATLKAQGDIVVAKDLRTAATLKFQTSPFPAAGHADMAMYEDPDNLGSYKCQATRWNLDLGGGDMDWEWEVV